MEDQTQNLKPLLRQIQSLQEFKRNGSEKTHLYPIAQQIPQFLINNLVSSRRIIKEFTGQDAILRSFYFNLMKLAFQLQNEEVDYIQLVKQVLIGQQEFGEDELQDNYFTDKQYRSFLKQFFNLLQNQQISNFEERVNQYPIIDDILLKMFRKLVPYPLMIMDSSDQEVAKRIFGYLSEKFDISMQVVGGCFKFIESDIFVYLSNRKKVYLVFRDPQILIRQLTDQVSSHSPSVSNKSQESSNKTIRKTRKFISKTEIIKPKRLFETSEDQRRTFSSVLNLSDRKNCRISGEKNSNPSEQKIFDKEFQLNFKDSQDKIVSDKSSLFQEYYGDLSSINLKTKKKSLSSLNDIISDKSSILKQQIPKFISNQLYRPINNSKQSGQSDSSQQAAEILSRQTSKKTTRQYQEEQLKQPHNLDQLIHKNCLSISQQESQVLKGQRLQTDNNTLSNKDYSYVIKDAKDLEVGFGKFTDNGLLQLLDEQYRVKIILIKQKFLQCRAKLISKIL